MTNTNIFFSDIEDFVFYSWHFIPESLRLQNISLREKAYPFYISCFADSVEVCWEKKLGLMFSLKASPSPPAGGGNSVNLTG